MTDHRTLLAQPSRAFLRHAWGVMYRHFTQVETEGKTFNPRVAYLHALYSFRDAALRASKTVSRDRAKVAHSTRPIHDPEKKLKAIQGLVNPPGGDHPLHSLTQKFEDEINRAKADAYT